MARTTADLIERLEEFSECFDQVLLWNAMALRLTDWLRDRGSTVTIADPGTSPHDEDMTPFPAAALDLIVSIGLLDSVNDLPGALLLMRRALKPGGLLLASFVGGGSGTTLRATLQDLEPDARRTHPLIDVRAGGDLLGRAGFTNIVADSDELTIRYPDLATLVADLRAAAATNLLIQRRIMTRRLYDALHARLDPGFTESLSLVTLTARAPL